MKSSPETTPVKTVIGVQPFPAEIVLNHIKDKTDVTPTFDYYVGTRRVTRETYVQSEATWVCPPNAFHERDDILASKRAPSLDCPYCEAHTYVQYDVYARIPSETINSEAALKKNVATYILMRQPIHLIWPITFVLLAFIFTAVSIHLKYILYGVLLFVSMLSPCELVIFHLRRIVVYRIIGRRPTLLKFPDFSWPAMQILENKAANPTICIAEVSTPYDMKQSCYGHDIAMRNGLDSPGDRLVGHNTLRIRSGAYDNVGVKNPYIPEIEKSGRLISYIFYILSAIYPEFRTLSHEKHAA
jgi:hypothetical protein